MVVKESAPTPTATPVSYFNISGNSIVGFSATGEQLYNNGELTELVIPVSYSIGSQTQTTETFTRTRDLKKYCDQNGYNFSFEYNGQTYTVSSQDDWYSYRFDIENIINNEGSITITITDIEYIEGNDYQITTVANKAFSYKDNLTSVIFLDNMTTIDTMAFSSCTSLSNIIFSNTISTIGTFAFAYASVGTINIPASVTSISASFERCPNIISFNVNANNNYYTSQNGVLFNKNMTKLIYYPAKNTRVSYTIPNTVTTIGANAFTNEYYLTSLIIPNTVTTLESQAFYECKSLTNLDIPESVTTIGGFMFSGSSSTLTSVIIRPIIPPTLDGGEAFKNDCVIYVPAQSIEDYKVATNWVNYASQMQPISE